MPIGSSATYLRPFRTVKRRKGPRVITFPENQNKSNNSRNVKWTAEEAEQFEDEDEDEDEEEDSSSGSPSPRSLTSPVEKKSSQQLLEKKSSQQLQRKKSSTISRESRRKLDYMKKMSKEQQRRQEACYKREIELKERIQQLEGLLKGTDTRARKWREGQQPPFIPGEQRRKIVQKESHYAVPTDSFPKLKSPWADIYALRDNPTGLDCRVGANPWHTCKFCPGDCWHDGYNSAIALFLFALVALLTYLVFGDIQRSASRSLVAEIQKTLCSICTAFIRWR